LKGVTEYDKCYDRAFFALWDFTTGQATNWRECYRGAKICALFFLKELDRKEELEAKGETALARRGLVASNTVFNNWLWNIVEDCNYHRAPMSRELLEVLYRVLGCTIYRRNPDKRIDEAREKFWELRSYSLRNLKRDLPVRETARELGVDPATIKRWKAVKEAPSEECDMELYYEVLERTNSREFWTEGSRWVIRTRPPTKKLRPLYMPEEFPQSGAE